MLGGVEDKRYQETIVATFSDILTNVRVIMYIKISNENRNFIRLGNF